MRKKKIFIVEDQNVQRNGTREALSDRGFEVYAAKNVAQARELAETNWNQFDVAIFDMRLEDPNEPHITGADIGIEFRQKYSNSPECIILSAYAEVEYYKLALELGVAAYLDKNKFGLFDLVRYVKAIALRKALSVENPETQPQIIEIVTQSSNISQAIKLFCQKVCEPELRSSLGIPFFLLLTDNDKSGYCFGDAKLPKESNAIYNTLQAIALAESSNLNPTPIDIKRLIKEIGTEITENYALLQDAVLLPVFNSKEHQISLTLVLLKEPEIDLSKFEDDEEIIPTNKVIEDPVELWKVLRQFVKPVLVETFLEILVEWNRIKNLLNMRMLKEISQICLWVGQEQAAILRNSSSLDDSIVKKLRAMANDLTESGNLLRHIEKPLDETVAYPSFSAKAILEEVWEDIKLAEELDNNFIFEIESDCNLETQENDLYVVFSRLLQWFVKRPFPTSPDIKPTIKIQCQSKGNESIIVFTDKSNRLSEKIRKELFVPFTQSVAIPFKYLPKKDGEEYIPGQYLPLYIAKMIVEVKYGGELIDCSDELEGTLGHKVVLRFIKEPQEI